MSHITRSAVLVYDDCPLRFIAICPCTLPPPAVPLFLLRRRRPPRPTLFPYTTLFRSSRVAQVLDDSVARLRRGDRDAVLLRFYQRKSFAEVGAALGEIGRAHV